MPTENLLISKNFGLLEDPKGRWGSFGASMVTNIALVALILLLTIAHHQVVKHAMQVNELVVPVEVPPPPPPKIEAPKVKVFAPPPPVIAKIDPPKIEMPKPVIEPPKPVHLDTPKPVPVIPPPPPKAVAPPPAPKVGMFDSPKPTTVANNMSKPSVKAGGFGDPLGATPNPNANRTQMAAVGSFGNAPGIGAGAGAARKGVVQGTAFGAGVANGVPGGTSHGAVASAGFANGVVGGTPGGTGHGAVTTTGFSANVGGKGVQIAQNNAEPSFVPPVVISEPKAQYTEQAQQAHVQGEVTLQVRFLASGQVEVLRVINGLGYGLDEQARRVAENIRFKPAMRNGQPVDHTTLIHVTFQLA